MIELAPGLFSTTKGWCIACPARSPNMRATMSVGPPAGNPTMIFTGLEGYAGTCAKAVSLAARSMDRTIRITECLERQHQLAEILPLEELEERLWKGIDAALDHVLLREELALRDPLRHLASALGVAIGIVEDHHPRHARAIHEEGEIVRGAFDGSRVVVLRDRAADDDARVQRDAPERRLENLAAHVVEIHVDAIGAM